MGQPERLPRAVRRLPSDWSAVRGGPLRGTPRWLLVGPGGGVLVTVVPYRAAVEVRASGLVHKKARTRDAQDARAAGWLASAWLTDLAGAYVPVRPVLLRPWGFPDKQSQPPVGYSLLHARALSRWLKAVPHAMGPGDAQSLARIARHSD